ncbi:hypothetical protein DPMN_151965 [Dreissena polymorpha]|uniref:Roc domain-containing protein n=1 Tax=Dreissena polymorpha TaxID=45954 RepID=A0A9D4J3G4_DREPO|nr:hypothetical protein DPMN_151965 [Dreissena polymorpha]
MVEQCPGDIKLRDAQSAKIFAKAIKDGVEVLNNIRLMVVGTYGVGKTSLVNNLIKDLRDKKLTPVSTEFIDLRRCELMDNADWCLDKKHKLVKYMLRFKKTFEKASQMITLTNIKEPILTPSFTDMLQIADDNADDSDAEAQLDTLEEIQNRVLQRADEEGVREFFPLVQETNETFSNIIYNRVARKRDITVSVWDFAGQALYYSTHQFFFNKNSIYLVLMDMTKSLDEFIQEDTLRGSLCGLMQGCTYLDVFKFWLNSIRIYSGYDSMEGRISPTIILVGTHKDKMHGDDKEIQKDKYFERALKSLKSTSILHHIYRRKFLVNNLSPDDSVFHELQREIELLAEEQDYWGDKYPFKCIQMEQFLDKMRDKGEQLLHIAEITAANSLFIHPLTEKEISLCLDIQHRHGNILYFNTDQLRHLVVLAPQWIIEAFKSFVTHVRYKKPKNSHYWDIYKKLAILKPEIVNSYGPKFLPYTSK